MPLYDYACRACTKTFEIEHSIKEPARTKCPECGKNKLERQISMTAAPQLQGVGWYKDGYSNKR